MRRCQGRERVGRFIGATGAICASTLWGVILFSFVFWLMKPLGVEALALIVLAPLSVIAAMLLVVSVADFVVLVRRVDTDFPWRVAGAHLLLAIVAICSGKGAWLAGLVLFGISATQLVAIRLFQMTPSHASSQR